MTSKEIEDGADTTLIAELDEAAEARIIDVLSKVFATNKYPGLRAAMMEGIERYRFRIELEEKQRQHELFEMQRYKSANNLQNALGNHYFNGLEQDKQIEYIKQEMERQKAATSQVAPAIKPNPFGKFGKFW